MNCTYVGETRECSHPFACSVCCSNFEPELAEKVELSFVCVQTVPLNSIWQIQSKIAMRTTPPKNRIANTYTHAHTQRYSLYFCVHETAKTIQWFKFGWRFTWFTFIAFGMLLLLKRLMIIPLVFHVSNLFIRWKCEWTENLTGQKKKTRENFMVKYSQIKMSKMVWFVT